MVASVASGNLNPWVLCSASSGALPPSFAILAMRRGFGAGFRLVEERRDNRAMAEAARMILG
jgi:hypothetical protein